MRTVYRAMTVLLLLAVSIVASAAAASGHFARDDYRELVIGPETAEGPGPITSMLAAYEWGIALIFALFFLGVAAWGFHKGFDLLHTPPENRMPRPWDVQ